MRLQQSFLTRHKVWALIPCAISMLFFAGLAVHSFSAPLRESPSPLKSSLPLDDPSDPCTSTMPDAGLTVSDELMQGGIEVATVTVKLKCKALAGTRVTIRYVQPPDTPADLVLPVKNDLTTFESWPKTLTFAGGEFSKQFKVKIHTNPKDDPTEVTMYICPNGGTLPCAGVVTCNIVTHKSGTPIHPPAPGTVTPASRAVVTNRAGVAGGGGNAQPIPVTITMSNDLDFNKQRETDCTVQISKLGVLPAGAGSGSQTQDDNAVMVTCSKEHRRALVPINPDGTNGYWPFRLQIGASQFPKFKIRMLRARTGVSGELDLPATATLYSYKLYTDPIIDVPGSPQHPLNLK